MKVLAYWAARTGIFLAVLVLLALVGWWDLIAVIAAFILAWLLGYLLLPGMRREAALQMDGWLSRAETRHRTDDAAEDAEADGGSDAQGQSEPDTDRP